jgi:acyl carrier protein phosphodiesterase
VNFLAHLYLAQPGGLADGPALLGNLLPDFWRGRLPTHLPDAIARGAERHRRVDRFTDRHSAFVETVSLLRPGWGRFAAVAADVLYDHALSLRWSDHHLHPLPLPIFIAQAYRQLADVLPGLPRQVQEVTAPPIRLMIEQDWLSRYATLGGIQQKFAQMSQRLTLRFERSIDLAAPVSGIADQIPKILEQFDAFLPELVAHLEVTSG